MTRKLRKYWRIFGVHWQAALIYRIELLLWRVIDVIPVLAMIALWLSVYRQGESLGQYGLTEIMSYYIVGQLLQMMTTVHFEEEGVHDVGDGTITRYLLKPYSYVQHAIIGALSWRTLTTVLTVIPAVALLWFMFGKAIHIPSPDQLLTLGALIIVGLTLDVLLSLLIVAAAFYFDQASSLIHLKWMLQGIFGGSMFPIDVYPSWLQQIARLLPFQFQFAVPLEIFLGKRTGLAILVSMVAAVIWILVLSLAVRMFWRAALRRFTAVGA